MYESITCYLGKLKPAKSISQTKTTEQCFIAGYPEYDETTRAFMHKMYDVVPNDGQNYDEVIYRKTGLDYHEGLTEADVSNLDGDTILYIIFSTIRGERFASGLGGTVETLGFSILQNAINYTEFLKQMHDAEINFCETLTSQQR